MWDSWKGKDREQSLEEVKALKPWAIKKYDVFLKNHPLLQDPLVRELYKGCASAYLNNSPGAHASSKVFSASVTDADVHTMLYYEDLIARCAEKEAELIQSEMAQAPEVNAAAGPTVHASEWRETGATNSHPKTPGRPKGRTEETQKIRAVWEGKGRPKTTDKICDEIALELPHIKPKGWSRGRIRNKVRCAIHRSKGTDSSGT
jgi:hypothetical protein